MEAVKGAVTARFKLFKPFKMFHSSKTCQETMANAAFRTFSG